MIEFKPKNIPKWTKVPRSSKEDWLQTHREFLKWKKTEEYTKWRKVQFAKQNALCYYCGIELRTVKTNIDHIVPKSRGGSNKPNNLVLVCWECNKNKYNHLLPKTKLKKYRDKHLSKTRAFHAEEELAVELAERFR